MIVLTMCLLSYFLIFILKTLCSPLSASFFFSNIVGSYVDLRNIVYTYLITKQAVSREKPCIYVQK